MRTILFSIAAVLIGWAIGFALFLRAVPEPHTNGAEADGIVVFTGVGGARITTAMGLLQDGAGGRLLISGVNPAISRSELAKMWEGDPEGFECCVDLGHEARTTVGNAAEVRDWARDNNYESLILVTSDYHMPRALLETHAQIRNVRLYAYPVVSGYLDEAGRPASLAAWRQLMIEYSKFLAVRVKTLVAGN